MHRSASWLAFVYLDKAMEKLFLNEIAYIFPEWTLKQLTLHYYETPLYVYIYKKNFSCIFSMYLSNVIFHGSYLHVKQTPTYAYASLAHILLKCEKWARFSEEWGYYSFVKLLRKTEE